MSGVCALAYVGLRGPDPAAWQTFASEVLGLQAVTGLGRASVHLRMDERAYRIVVDKGAPGLGFLGLELATREDLERLATILAADGVAVTPDPELAVSRGVRHLFRCADPAGNRVELVVGQLIAGASFMSPAGATFRTGVLGLGHVFLNVPDAAAACHFYVGLLGFRLSDTIALSPKTLGTFLRCNPRHHTLAYAVIPGAPAALGHLMIEATTLDAVGRAIDAANERGLRISRTLGMHTNDKIVSFYVRAPSGVDIEYGWNGRLVDERTWIVNHYDSTSSWGHKPP